MNRSAKLTHQQRAVGDIEEEAIAGVWILLPGIDPGVDMVVHEVVAVAVSNFIGRIFATYYLSMYIFNLLHCFFDLIINPGIIQGLVANVITSKIQCIAINVYG